MICAAFVRPILYVSAIAVMAGCTASKRYSGIEPTDLSALRLGAPRATIDAVLGPPTSEKPACNGVQRTYAFDLGYEPFAGPGIFAAAGVVYVMTAGLYGITDAIENSCTVACQKGEAWVTFAPDDTVAGYRLGWQDPGTCQGYCDGVRARVATSLGGRNVPAECG